MILSFDNKFIRLDEKHVGLARQASPFLRCFWFHLTNLISKETNLVFSITLAAGIHAYSAFIQRVTLFYDEYIK